MTSIQRRLNVDATSWRPWRLYNVDATSWRCIDVETTLYRRHVPAGSASVFSYVDFFLLSYVPQLFFFSYSVTVAFPIFYLSQLISDSTQKYFASLFSWTILICSTIWPTVSSYICIRLLVPGHFYLWSGLHSPTSCYYLLWPQTLGFC